MILHPKAVSSKGKANNAIKALIDFKPKGDNEIKASFGVHNPRQGKLKLKLCDPEPETGVVSIENTCGIIYPGVFFQLTKL